MLNSNMNSGLYVYSIALTIVSGEFKKADFAKIVREYILSTKNPPVSDELIEIIKKIKLL